MIGGIATIGGGGLCVWENFAHFDPHDRKSTEGTYEFFDASFKFGREKKYPPGMERINSVSRGSDGRTTPKEERERILSASRQPTVFYYQRKIKEAFNPNNLGDAYYVTLED
jgi:hypothetical protein